MTEEKPVVIDPVQMSDEVFMKHFNARHWSIPGLAKTAEHMSPGVVSSLRAYHDLVHVREYEQDPTKHHVEEGKIVDPAETKPVTHDHLED